MDVLFLHVPKKNGKELHILNMPLGLTALCDHLIRNGISAKILHLSIEELLNRHFNLNKFIKENQVKLVAMDLHWHQQSYSVMEIAKRIKSANKNCKILLGGFTASFFTGEILNNFKEIDFIIKGDAEIPILELARAVINNLGEDALSKVQNLAWRNANKVIENPQTYVAKGENLDELSYANIDTINNADFYTHTRDLGNRINEIPKEDILKSKSFVFYNPGRGCPVNCSFCGGSCISQELINKRKDPIFMSNHSVIRDLIGLKRHAIDNLYMSFDPFPQSDYFPKLFDEIKTANLPYSLIFESWALPTKDFIDKFAATFGKDSYIVISPDTGSEKVRKLNKGYYYSNQELFDTLDYLYKNKIDAMLYFSSGFPFESKADYNETAKLIDQLKSKYSEFFNLSAMPIELDPASPMWLDSQKYNIKAERKNFKDVYEASKKHTPKLGYSTDVFSQDEILKNCRNLSDKIFE